jgi:hypothetical protein
MCCQRVIQKKSNIHKCFTNKVENFTGMIRPTDIFIDFNNFTAFIKNKSSSLNFPDFVAGNFTGFKYTIFFADGHFIITQKNKRYVILGDKLIIGIKGFHTDTENPGPRLDKTGEGIPEILYDPDTFSGIISGIEKKDNRCPKKIPEKNLIAITGSDNEIRSITPNP